MLRSFALLALLGLAACASTPQEESTHSEDAVTTGGRWRSSLDEGFYDAGTSASLFVGHDVTTQTFVFRAVVAREMVVCLGEVDLPVTGEHAGEMIFVGRASGCSLTFTREGSQVTVKGTKLERNRSIPLDVTLSPREGNAFVGTYLDAAEPEYAQVEVQATSNAETTLRMTMKGEELIALQTGKVDDSYDHYVVVVDSRCSLKVEFSFDLDGKRELWMRPLGSQNLDACPAQIPTYFRER